MDPIESINPAKDSTLAMMLAAQARDVELHYFGQRDLWVRDGTAAGRDGARRPA
jgi:glutathione synthase